MLENRTTIESDCVIIMQWHDEELELIFIWLQILHCYQNLSEADGLLLTLYTQKTKPNSTFDTTLICW